MSFITKDKVQRFLGLFEQLDLEAVRGEDPSPYTKFLDNPKDNVIMHRVVDIEDLKSEDDIRFLFSTPDSSVMEIFDRFQSDEILRRINKRFLDENYLESLKRFIWNYKTLTINKKTGEFEVFSGFSPNMVAYALLPTGTYARKQIYVD